jgi:HAMP domain-containing protein
MKLKILLTFVLVLLTSVIIGVYLGFASINKSKSLIQSASSSALIQQVTSSRERQSEYHLQLLRDIFVNAENNLLSLQGAARKYFERPELYNLKENWDIDSRLVHQENNQLVSKEGDTSAVLSFIQQPVNNDVLDNILTSAMLDNDFKSIYESNDNISALYFNGASGYVRYYPGKKLVDVIAPDNNIYDFDIFTDVQIENNPEQEILWTPLYFDEAGHGNMITAIAPVYAKQGFAGTVGIDISVQKLLTNFLKQNNEDNAFIVDDAFNPVIINDEKPLDFIFVLTKEQSKEKSKLTTKLPKNKPVLEYELHPQVLSALKNLDKPSGYTTVKVNDKVVNLTLTKIEKLDWLYVTVLPHEKIFGSSVKLNQQLGTIINNLISSSIALYLVLLVIVVLLTSWIVSRILQPVQELTDVTKLIANGDYDQEIKIKASDEIQILVDNFQLMQRSILKKHDKLQDSVEETSQELVTQKHLFSEIYKNSSDGLSIMIDGKFLDCNDGLLKMFKINSREELANMKPGRLAPEIQPDGIDSIEMFNKGLAACIKTGFSHHERLVKDTEGNEFWVDAILVKVTDKDKTIVYSIAKLIVD